MSTALKLATYTELLALPENVVGEILDGTLYTSPRPSAEHGSAAFELSVELGGPFRRGKGGPGGWWFIGEPELHLGGDVVVPDLAGWRQARMPAAPRGASISLSPDWVCEILSPSTARVDRFTKSMIYAANGVSLMWLLDPTLRLLEVYRLQQSAWLRVGIYDDSEPIHAEPFDAVALDLRVIFGGDPRRAG